MNKRLLLVAGLLLVLVLALAACGGQKAEPTQAPAQPTEAPTEAPAQPTEAPTEAPPTNTPVPPTPTPIPPTPTPIARNGAWADSLVFTVQEDADVAVSQLESKDIDIYAYTVSDPELYKKVKDNKDLTYAESFGSYTELTFNPVGPEYGEGELNPFSNPKIREAVNLIIDRNYVVEEIYGGLAIPKFLPSPALSLTMPAMWTPSGRWRPNTPTTWTRPKRSSMPR